MLLRRNAGASRLVLLSGPRPRGGPASRSISRHRRHEHEQILETESQRLHERHEDLGSREHLAQLVTLEGPPSDAEPLRQIALGETRVSAQATKALTEAHHEGKLRP